MKIEEPLAETLMVSPNSDQTALEYWESQEAQKLLHGNSYAEKLFIGDQLVGFVSAVDTVDFRNVSAPTDCTGKVGKEVRVTRRDIWHIWTRPLAQIVRNVRDSG